MATNEIKQQLRFDKAAYVARIKRAIDDAGGLGKFAESVGASPQTVQGWRDSGSIPRTEDWSKVENSGKGMAWFLFGVDDMPEQKAIDRQALLSIVARLRKELAELEVICEGIAPQKKERRRQDYPRLKSVKRA